MHVARRLTYGRAMPETRSSTARAVIVYSVLRLVIFLAAWALVWYLTPLDALWAAVAGLLISGAISLVVLDRHRGRVGRATGRFFARINERIDAATRAEDLDESWPPAEGSRDSEQEPEHKTVGQHEDARAGEGGDEPRPLGTAEHGAQGGDGEQAGRARQNDER
jgi:hypothetical protein